MTLNEIASRSTCLRVLPSGKPAHVGCVVRLLSNYTDDVIRIEAHNGTGQCKGNIQGGCGCIHAERAALDQLPKRSRHPFETLWLVIEVTLAPCTECAKAILQKASELGALCVVYYGELYRDPQGIYDLWEGGAQVAPLLRACEEPPRISPSQ